MIVGDIVYPRGEDAGYDPQFFAPYRSLLSAIPFYAALGNHDLETSPARRSSPSSRCPATARRAWRPRAPTGSSGRAS